LPPSPFWRGVGGEELTIVQLPVAGISLLLPLLSQGQALRTLDSRFRLPATGRREQAL